MAMKYSASQAAKATGKSVPTITRAIKSGKISADKDGDSWVIDPAELHRVFPVVKVIDLNAVKPVTHNMLRHETPETPNSSGALQREIELLRERLADKDALIATKDGVIATKDAVIEDLRDDRNHWREMAENTTRLLEAPKSAAEPMGQGVPESAALEPVKPKKKWWQFG